mgnify:CR=1 FL=1
MKIYATSSSVLDKYVGKDVWILVTLGVHDRLLRDQPLRVEVDDYFKLHSWIRIIKPYNGNYNGYVFNYMYAEPFRDTDYIPPKSFMDENREKFLSQQFIARSGDIRISRPLEMYSTEELFEDLCGDDWRV